MRKLQTRYTILNILFMAIGSSLYGYAAIYLYESGLTNTQTGVVKGGGCVLLVLLPSHVTALVQRIKKLTTRKLCLILYALIGGIVLLLLLASVPVYLLMPVYMTAIFLQLTMMPLTANMAMEYIQGGENLNFGFSRGMGSLFYAITAVLLGQTCVTVFIGGAGAFAGNVLGGILQDAYGLSAMYLFVCLVTAGCCLFVQYLLHAHKAKSKAGKLSF